MKVKNNILFFVTSLDSGGLENYLLRFISNYSENFNEIFVWCKSSKGGVLENKYTSIKNVSIIKKNPSTTSLSNYTFLLKTIKKKKIHSVCDFTGNFSGFNMLMSYLIKVPNRIVFYRNSEDKFKPNYVKQKYNKFLNFLVQQFSTKILSNSKAAFDYFFSDTYISSPKYKVIYNGINAKKFETSIDTCSKREKMGIPKNAFVLGHVGRFNYQKNHETILKVFSKLLKIHNDLFLVLCGNNTLQNIPKLIEVIDASIKNRVLILGNRDDVNEVLKTMDIFFFPSTIEGQPNALIEAMISDIPVVTSNISAIKETTPKEIHSYLKAPYDVNGFVSLISQIKVEEELRKSLKLSNWAIPYFDFTKRFDEFNNELNN